MTRPPNSSADGALAARPLRLMSALPPGQLLGFLLAASAVVFIALLSYLSLEDRAETATRITQTIDATRQLTSIVSSVQDAETGQRGFLLTGNEQYLDPYRSASAELPRKLAEARRIASEDATQSQRMDALASASNEKFKEMSQTIELRRAGKAEEALAIVQTDRGKAAMDRIRTVATQMIAEEQRRLNQRQAEWQAAVDNSFRITLGGSLLLLLLIAAAALIASREHRAREIEAWLRTGQAGLSERMQGDQRLERLGENVLAFLGDYLEAQVGAIYVAQDGGLLRRVGGYALAPAADDLALRPGDGLTGEVARTNRAMHVREVPRGYLPVSSALGRETPRELLIAPSAIDGVVQAVVELGFFGRVQAADRTLLERVAESVAAAMRAAKDRSRLESLLEETQRQSEELQAQQEELRVSNEELEEQGRALKQSQARLEIQQTELEQSNSQLEEQAQRLEHQRDELARAQAVLTEKAAELERSNQYKSEFLSNMSHELRTPLNSTLILAKLLADNKAGNLSEEQVRFAQTISSAGNDLLTLINDILDLSKIEAGKIDLNVEPVSIAKAVDSVVKTLAPLAQQKRLAFSHAVDPGVPADLQTDPQRLGQILKNLLSNALKFTEKGEVVLQVLQRGPETVSFAVRDTGIGIAEHQHELVFEAFRQADGSTHRKYGGTGLGLSISRDLARRLGGEIDIRSAPGKGSTFTLTLPLRYTEPPEASGSSGSSGFVPLPAPAPFPAAPRSERAAAEAPALRPDPRPAAAPVQVTPTVEDDRAQLRAGARLILVIEDDVRFAAILRDMAHELDFQCIVTHAAQDGLDAAATYRPSAILLDMNLPDHSGLGVLDSLKRDPLTRHVPVHVISVADYRHEALELGAIGYALKPVKREQLVEAFRRLEAKATQGLRRVLVVEDDARQRDSMEQLLGNAEVQITAVERAGDALAQLQHTTFDCMVMDLNLPDLSGYELLEKMAEQDDVSFPPVIVYTGRTLERDEEQRLRRFSKSIIIKDARSPERLLDEVTLFLHQVESTLPVESQRLLRAARDREARLEGRCILVVEDDVRNIFALSSVLEPKGVVVALARNGQEALDALDRSMAPGGRTVDLVLMDIMMPEMDGMTAMREIRKRAEWRKLPIIALTAKAMKDDQERCLAAGANDYIAKPLDVEKLLSLVRVWMPK